MDEPPRYPKIADFYFRLPIEQDIARLDVTMYLVEIAVDIFQTLESFEQYVG